MLKVTIESPEKTITFSVLKETATLEFNEFDIKEDSPKLDFSFCGEAVDAKIRYGRQKKRKSK